MSKSVPFPDPFDSLYVGAPSVTKITKVSQHLTSDGTTRPAQNLRITYGGGTNWEAAMQRGKDIIDALPNDRKNYDIFVRLVVHAVAFDVP